MPLPEVHHEDLAHFNCPFCKKWWSIGSISEPGRNYWYCPWCGSLLTDRGLDPAIEIAQLEKRLKELKGE
jgi:ribosomal protein L37AE/L43A